MEKNFEDKFMDIQSGLISLCLEVTDSKVDKVFAYASIEEKSSMFNAFFEKEGKILSLTQIGVDKKVVMEFLRIGTGDIEEIRNLFDCNKVKFPREMKMYYDVKTGKYDADYEYKNEEDNEAIFDSCESFLAWYNKEKNDR